MADVLRIGIVGAGANTKARHVPRLRAQKNVEIVGVCNRTVESSTRAAADLGIPKVFRNWRELVESPEIDAVLIGTWPYLHCPVTLTALDAGKHVLTEARMAMNAGEARLMLERSRQRPHLMTQVVPSPFTLKVDRTVQKLLAEGYLGTLLALDVRANSPDLVDRNAPLHWRQDRDLSGLNILTMGIWYEAIVRWVGEAQNVMATAQTVVRSRRDATGRLRSIAVPDHVDILASMVCGAQARFQFSGVTGFSPAPEVWLYGTEGTLRFKLAGESLLGARRGEPELKEIAISTELAGGWRVEEEFVNAVRGQERVQLTTFEDGLKYMQFTEAVNRSVSTRSSVTVQDI
ncbi:MAG: Gfo/Idh/MocA family oxidoreductase [Acidobacteriota bacterium]